jgi:pimeloyl-ACP methyl ester carboxylesterase
VTMDLPCDDGSASFETYADVVCAAVHGCNDDVMLVGHSLAGSTVALVAARRPVHHLVYLCAAVPDIGRSVFDQIRDEPDMLNPLYFKGLSEPDAQSRTTWVDLEVARAVIYADCDDSTAKAALNRLRPQTRYPSTLPFPLSEFPAVRCTSVVCTEDQFIWPEWSRRTSCNPSSRCGGDSLLADSYCGADCARERRLSGLTRVVIRHLRTLG